MKDTACLYFNPGGLFEDSFCIFLFSNRGSVDTVGTVAMALPAFANHPHRRPICTAKVAPFHPAGHQSHAVLASEPTKTVNAEQTSSPTAPSVLASYILCMHVQILTIGRLEKLSVCLFTATELERPGVWERIL